MTEGENQRRLYLGPGAKPEDIESFKRWWATLGTEGEGDQQEQQPSSRQAEDQDRQLSIGKHVGNSTTVER